MLKTLSFFSSTKKEATGSSSWANPTEPIKAKYTTDEIDASDDD